MNATHIDLLLKNCKAYAMDEKNTCYTTIGIHDGRIVYTGQADENSAPCAKTVIDMAGRPVLPAFTDTHMHMINSAYLQTIFRLFGVTSIKRVIEMGKEYLKSGEFSRERWVFGRGWNQELFEEGRMITRDDLDEISSSVPICIVRICGHIAVLNSAALELLRASAEVEAYAHNIDWDSGVLRESAVKYCYKIMPPIPKPIMKNLIDMAQRALLSQGITAVGTDDFISLPGNNLKVIYESYQEMAKEGELKVRVSEQCGFVEVKDLEDFIAFNRKNRIASDFLRMNVIKIMLDGSLGGRTALLKEPYADCPKETGTQTHSREKLNKMVRIAHDSGYQVAVHAIGDKAADIVADAYIAALKENPRNDHRHGIVHFQITDDDLLKKVRDANIIAYIQPVFLSSDLDMLTDRLGEERAQHTYMWKTMQDMGIHTGGGSDAPVESFNVLENIFCAVTRQRIHSENHECHCPQECLDIKDAVALFTSKAAYLTFEENKKGTIEVGKYADLVVLSDDIFQIDAQKIQDVAVLKTMVNGEFVFSKE